MCHGHHKAKTGKRSKGVTIEGLNLPLSISNQLIAAFTPPQKDVSWIDQQIEKHDTKNELWQWESLMMYHFKKPINEIREMDDDLFFDNAARLKWVIEQEQKKWQMNTGN